MVSIDKNICDRCGTCVAMCKVAALKLDQSGIVVSNDCIDCGACVRICPIAAIRPE